MTRKYQKVIIISVPVVCTVYFLLHGVVWNSSISGSNSRAPRVDPVTTGVKSYGRAPSCHVTCHSGVPCQYRHEVAMRIIVLAYNRPESLRKCLERVRQLDTMGDQVVVNVWIDRSKSGEVHQPSLDVAVGFAETWDNGTACVHVQERNVYVMGQWINTWKPWPGTREVALILEDDVDISTHAYRWLKAVTSQYGNQSDIAGYTLRMEDWSAFGDNKMVPFVGPRADTVYAYPMMSTWGFAPHPQRWAEFQNWFAVVYPRGTLRPLIPNLFQNRWYETFESRGGKFENSMWEMWHHYYSYKHNLYTVFCNLIRHLNRRDVLLSTNRREKGLHFDGQKRVEHGHRLLNVWHDHFSKFPQTLKKYQYNNSLIQ